jgi:hypothetical protein
LAVNFVTNFSLRPLQVSSFVGIVVAAVAVLLGVWCLARALIFGVPVPGFASLFVVITMLGGVQLISLGILGEYLGRVLMNSNGRPPYSVLAMYGSAVQIPTSDENGAG